MRNFYTALFLSTLASGLHAQESQAAPQVQQPAPQVANAPGGLSLIPNRVVLEGRDRAGEVMLRNSGSVRAAFRVSIVEKNMTEDGDLADREKKEGDITAADLIRFSPRQVELEPGESQIVRIQLRKPENLPDGEYRSHIVFTNTPPPPIAEPIDGDKADRQLSFAIAQAVSISIPVIVRHGKVNADVALSQSTPAFALAKEEGYAPSINLWLERKGNRSFVGDIKAVLESGGDKPKGTVLWELKSVGIYTNLHRRKVIIPVPDALGGKLKGAKAKVTFTPVDVKIPPVSTEVALTL